ncbi:MAG: Rieske (2Fe-2S) protein [Haliea sp.]|nr:Rieske (2Fe-2S) protein [Haliea sp.]
MRFRPLEKLINLHDGYRREFRIDEWALLLAQEQGEVYLLEARCPHREHALDVASIRGGVIECPLHRYRFRLVDGAMLHASEEPCRALRVWPLVYEGNELGVMLPD